MKGSNAEPERASHGGSSAEEIARSVRALGTWFHNMDLGGVLTAPEHFLGDYPRCKWRAFEHAVPADLAGKSVLDVGCNAGFYSFEMKRRGAARVLGIDEDEEYLAQARFAAGIYGQDVEFRRLSVYDVGGLDERFDLVIFMGVLYHLRYPLLALDLLREHVARDLLLFQSMLRGADELEHVEENYAFDERAHFERPGYPKLHFVESCYAQDPTNWWVPNKSCAEAMLRAAAFEIIDNPEQEVYLCRVAEARAAVELPGALRGAAIGAP
jgi:tRNA (mo5U34)-methyltransferase